MRKPHVIRSVGMGTNPTYFIVLQSAAKQQHHSESDDTGTLDFHSVRMTGLNLVGEELRIDRSVSYSIAGMAWEAIETWSIGKRAVWIVSMSARENAAIMDLWGRVLAGKATLSGADPWARDDDKSKASEPNQGYVVLEGPPTVITFKGLRDDTTYTWIDPANYGVCDLTGYASPADQMKGGPEIWQAEPWLDSGSLHIQVAAARRWLTDYLRTLNELGIGAIEHTAASQAMSGYRRQYMSYPITVHDSMPVLELERQSLYGGRCECMYLGTAYSGKAPRSVAIKPNDHLPDAVQATICDRPPPPPPDDTVRRVIEDCGPIYHLDVNSLYPSVAQDAILPSKLITVCKHVDVQRVLDAASAIPVIAKVLVEVDRPCVPVRIDGLTLFPTGRFWSTLCGPEISLAHANGRVVACSVLAAYEGRPLYEHWVRRLYAARIKAKGDINPGMERCIKAILNASFGKWAQRSKRWVDVPDDVAPWPFYQWWQTDQNTKTPEQWRSFAWSVQRQVDAGEPAESFPAITSYINSLGRVRLWELMEIADRCNVYYYDTDSLWVSEKGYHSLARAGEVDGSLLGKLKVVGKHDEIEWYGIKRYCADGTLTMAGCSSPSVKDGEAFARQLKAAPTDHYLRHKDPPGLDRTIARVRLRTPYDLGKVNPDGWTEPFKLHT